MSQQMSKIQSTHMCDLLRNTSINAVLGHMREYLGQSQAVKKIEKRNMTLEST